MQLKSSLNLPYSMNKSMQLENVSYQVRINIHWRILTFCVHIHLAITYPFSPKVWWMVTPMQFGLETEFTNLL